jgi:hypothetical protein
MMPVAWFHKSKRGWFHKPTDNADYQIFSLAARNAELWVSTTQAWMIWKKHQMN